MNNNYIAQIQDQLADSMDIEDIMDHIDMSQVLNEELFEDSYYNLDQEA